MNCYVSESGASANQSVQQDFNVLHSSEAQSQFCDKGIQVTISTESLLDNKAVQTVIFAPPQNPSATAHSAVQTVACPQPASSTLTVGSFEHSIALSQPTELTPTMQTPIFPSSACQASIHVDTSNKQQHNPIQRSRQDYDFEISSNIIINASYNDLPVDPDFSENCQQEVISERSEDNNMSVQLSSLVKIGNNNQKYINNKLVAATSHSSDINNTEKKLKETHATVVNKLCGRCLKLKTFQIKYCKNSNADNGGLIATNVRGHKYCFYTILGMDGIHSLIHQSETLVISIKNKTSNDQFVFDKKMITNCRSCLLTKTIRLIRKHGRLNSNPEYINMLSGSVYSHIIIKLLYELIEDHTMHYYIHKSDLLLINITDKPLPPLSSINLSQR